MSNTDAIEKLQKSLGLSPSAARVYFAALERGRATLTELAREAGFARTVMTKPIRELVDVGLLAKQMVGKRTHYVAANPQELPVILERKKHILLELSQLLTQQISAPGQDIQVRWFNGVSGIETAIKEFFTRSKGKEFRQFENADTYEYLGTRFGDEIVRERVKSRKFNWLIVIGTREKTGWYQERLARKKEELREVILVSADEYPFHANIAVSENLVLIFEYKHKPFALLIDNQFVAQSIWSIHQMVWDRYQARERF